MKKELLTERELTNVHGGKKINWGHVAGSCAGSALIGGVFGGTFGAAGGCAAGAMGSLWNQW